MQQYCTKKEEGRQAGCLGVPDPTLQLGPGVGTLMILATVTVYQGTAYISICVNLRLSVNLM